MPRWSAGGAQTGSQREIGVFTVLNRSLERRVKALAEKSAGKSAPVFQSSETFRERWFWSREFLFDYSVVVLSWRHFAKLNFSREIFLPVLFHSPSQA